jgi:hypothetical protein
MPVGAHNDRAEEQACSSCDGNLTPSGQSASKHPDFSGSTMDIDSSELCVTEVTFLLA